MHRRAAVMTETGTTLKKVADAMDPLYKSLDDGQKRRFAMLERMLRPGDEGQQGREFRGREGERGRDGSSAAVMATSAGAIAPTAAAKATSAGVMVPSAAATAMASAGSMQGPAARTFRRRPRGAASRNSRPIYVTIARWSYPQPPDTIADAWEPPG